MSGCCGCRRYFAPVVAVLIALLLGGCSDSRERPPGAEHLRVAEESACANPRRIDVERSFGETMRVIRSESALGTCTFESDDRSLSVVVRILEANGPAAFDAVARDALGSVGLPVVSRPRRVSGIGDQAVVFGAEGGGRTVFLARRGGSVLALQVTGGDDNVVSSADRLARWVVEDLPDKPFVADADGSDCDLLAVADVASALAVDVDTVSVNQGVGDGGCSLVVGDRLTISIGALRQADPSVLPKLGRTRSTNGVEVTSVPVPIDGLTDAVWIQEASPTPTNGEVYLVRGGRLYRVAVSGNGVPLDVLRQQAVAVASLLAATVG